MLMYSSKSSVAAFPVSIKAIHCFEKKMPSVLKSQPIKFNFDLPFPQNNYHAVSAVCLLDFLRPINNLSVICGDGSSWVEPVLS